MLKAILDRLVVEPYYDADKIGSIYIPDAFKNPEAQQGIVKSVGPLAAIREGAYVFFPPFRSVPLHGSDLISIREKDVVAFLSEGELYPPWEHVMVAPEWESKYRSPSGLILTENYAPVLLGTIVRITEGVDHLAPGDRVVVAPGAGHEIGFEGAVYYFIHERDILAKCLKS